VRTPGETLDEAQRLLDAGRPFHAHEVFEDAWKASREADEAGLWKGLAQLAVGYTHRLRGNPVGADRLLRRAARALAPYAAAEPYEINVEQLRGWALSPQDRAMPPLRGTV
jgi:predicted metal-dependent hydrolase